MTCNEKQRTEYEHRRCLTLVVDIFTKLRSNSHCEQWEHRKHSACTLTFVAHIAICYERHHCHQCPKDFVLLILHEVACKRCYSNHNHYHILNICNGFTCPERIWSNLIKCKVALKHIYSILLEWENCRVIKHTKQCHQPESAT